MTDPDSEPTNLSNEDGAVEQVLALPEGWHRRLALYSLVTMAVGLGAILLRDKQPWLLAAGLTTVVLCVVSAIVSRFWTKVTALPLLLRLFVWFVALLGGAVIISLMISLFLLRWSIWLSRVLLGAAGTSTMPSGLPVHVRNSMLADPGASYSRTPPASL
jgi:hypothetical protein